MFHRLANAVKSALQTRLLSKQTLASRGNVRTVALEIAEVDEDWEGPGYSEGLHGVLPCCFKPRILALLPLTLKTWMESTRKPQSQSVESSR
jgi:hypothetical protein